MQRELVTSFKVNFLSFITYFYFILSYYCLSFNVIFLLGGGLLSNQWDSTPSLSSHILICKPTITFCFKLDSPTIRVLATHFANQNCQNVIRQHVDRGMATPICGANLQVIYFARKSFDSLSVCVDNIRAVFTFDCEQSNVCMQITLPACLSGDACSLNIVRIVITCDSRQKRFRTD